MDNLIITQQGYNLVANGDVIPAQYSANIKIQFIKDTNYEDYIVIPSLSYGAITNVLPFKEGFIEIPKSAFQKNGVIYIAFLLKSTISNEEINTNQLELYVKKSVGGSEILPSDDQTWIAVVMDTVNQYMDIHYVNILNDLIESNQALNVATLEIQENVNNTIDILNQKLENNDFVPKHKIENGVLYFSNPDGSWDDGFELSGLTTFKIDGEVKSYFNMYTTRNTSALKTHVQLIDENNNITMLESSTEDVYVGDTKLSDLLIMFKILLDKGAIYLTDPSDVINAIKEVIK